MMKIEYPYYVEYVDENGEFQCDYWNQQTMDRELRRHDVNIVHIELAYPTQLALGLVEDEEPDSWDEPADIDSDCGFDPYMGCFSNDC